MAYGSDQGLISYLDLTGRALPSGYSPSIARGFGTQYVNMWEDNYLGTAMLLPDSFPRDRWPAVPVSVEYAAYEAGLAYADGVAIFGSGGSASGQVIHERVDVIEQRFAGLQDGQTFWDAGRYIWPLAYSYLRPFMRKGNFCPSAMVVGCGV